MLWEFASSRRLFCQKWNPVLCMAAQACPENYPVAVFSFIACHLAAQKFGDIAGRLASGWQP